MFPSTPRQDDRRISLRSPYSSIRSPPARAGYYHRRESLLELANDSKDQIDSAGDAAIGDLVEVPGGWHGTVMYVGSVSGRSGQFLGVDLIALDADKGRHDGTYNGVSYFPTKASTSGMFVPQGKCRVIDSNPRKDRSADVRRPSSRQLTIRPNSRLRSVSGRSFSGSQGTGSPPPDRGENAAAAQQKLLNENARLSKSLAELEKRLSDTQKAKAIQTHEMEELISTVSELEALQGSSTDVAVSVAEVEELRAYIENREAKIAQLRSEAEVRRTEFKQVTEHQQATIEELKAMHAEQLKQMEQQKNDLENRLIDSEGASPSNDQEQMNLLQDQLAELSEELDALVGNQERARQDIDLANARINDLEQENNRLLGELDEARMKLEVQKQDSHNGRRVSRRVSSLEKLPDAHPQKRQTIEFLETEIERLKQDSRATKSQESVPDKSSAYDQAVEEVANLKALLAQLQAESATKTGGQEELRVLRTELDAERQARRSLEDQHDQLESTLERTIIQLNSKSPKTMDHSASKRAPNRTITPTPVPSLDTDYGLRSPRPSQMSSRTLSPSPTFGDAPKSDGNLWCEFCEEPGHDIIACKAVFGSAEPTPAKKATVLEPTIDEDEMF